VFIGISDIREIAVEKTLLGSEVDLETRTEGKRRAVELARDF